MSAPVGKWMVVRSDRLVLSVDKADHPYVIGRARQLPSSQTLSHKYASREQLTVVWHPPHLYLLQTGKNPSVLGPRCALVPSARASDASAPSWQQASVHFCATASVKEPTAQEKSDGTVLVEVPLSDPLTVTQAPDRHTISEATVHFPEEVGLPTLTVRFEGTEVTREDATAAATSRTAAEMLAVPSARAVAGGGGDDDDDDDDDELSDGGSRRHTTNGRPSASAVGAASSVSVNPAAGGESKPEWRGLLDVALQQQQQQQQKEQETVGIAPAAAASTTPPAPLPPRPSPPAPPVEVPFGAAAAAATATAPEVASATQKPPAAAAAAAHKMGFWEWKQHANGKDSDPSSWRKYNLAVAKVLEEAYQDPKITKLKIPDAAMFDKPGAKGSTYGVCFAEKSLNSQMIQYNLDDPGKFRVIRRTGGTPVDRKRARSARVLPSPTTSDESDSEESASSSSSSSGSSSDDSGERRTKRRRRA